MIPLSFTLYFLISLAGLSQTYPSETQFCYDDHGNFTSGSAYAKNRDAVLRSLSPNVTAQDGFYATNSGESPNTVYAITFCRGDASADGCGICVRSGVEDLAANCPNQRAAYSMYYMSGEPPCIIRYSDTPIYGKLENYPATPYFNTDDLNMDQDKFDAIWRNLTQTLASKAANGSSKLKYAADQVELPDNQTMYSHTQCSPDLTPYDCRRCLFTSIEDYDSCCRGKKGGGIDRPSCIFRWDLYPFLESQLSPPPSPSSPPPAAPPARGTDIGKGNMSKSLRIVIAVVGSTLVFMMVLVFVYCFIRRTRSNPGEIASETSESLQFKISEIKTATNFFSEANKLGEGGFGIVYRGKLKNGQDIAVKRLQRCSNHGQQQFKNEVTLMARLQHKNLIKLLGYCLEEGERLIILEFACNASLEGFISNSIKRTLLSWERRSSIITGIARGLLYLHEESRLRIIHRDLKPSNILLDENMNPKISDFGTARLFVLDESRAKTSQIAGTFGYMAPEYVKHGEISGKIDVFSFGVMVLEIICGKMNSNFCTSGNSDRLLDYAWKNWENGTPFGLVDPMLNGSSRSEMLRCIHIALLCVQENAGRRPTMASVVLMFGNHSTTLPMPTRPAYLTDASGRDMPVSSINEASMTDPYAR